MVILIAYVSVNRAAAATRPYIDGKYVVFRHASHVNLEQDFQDEEARLSTSSKLQLNEIVAEIKDWR